LTEPTSNADLFRAMGRVARGLSCLFWGVPLTLVVVVLGLRTDEFIRFGIVPPMIATALLVTGTWHLGTFQQQERIWVAAQSRAHLLAMMLFGLSPFLYWAGRTVIISETGTASLPQIYFTVATLLFHLCAIGFLGSLNTVIARLAAMLPDETLRLESRSFAALNHWLLWITLIVVSLIYKIRQTPGFPSDFPRLREVILANPELFTLPFLLLAVAMTMALLWKSKEVILENIFSQRP
jgi:cytochrome bd-type quinol oxidase subunit 2